MSQKELVERIASGAAEISKNEASVLLQATVESLREMLVAGKSVGFNGFGTFEVKKKEERMWVNPTTKTRLMIPPKLAVNFKQSSILKDKLKNIGEL
jgi:DNA-binding protein HU-beta